jgi:hypothetical protein
MRGDMRVILELGSFQGLSARWLAQRIPPKAVLICIDHWKGSTEHHRRPDWEAKLATLFDTFLDNLWPYREQVVPMRTTTLVGMRELHALEVVPDVIYIDAAHETEHVYADTDLALRLFPDAEILGDDWPHDSVRAGVIKAARRCGMLGVHGCSCWQIYRDKRCDRPPPEPYPEPNDVP